MEPEPKVSSSTRCPPVIFVLDDDAAIRDSIQMLLEMENYRVSTFDSVARFMTAFSQASRLPACVLLDVHLPEGDGRAVSAHLTAGWPGLPVILMSGQNNGTLEAEARAAGARQFLEKPVSHLELFEAVAQALGR